MRTIIAGSRTISNPLAVESAIRDSGFEITEVYCGMARGVDLMGKHWAEKRGIHVREFPANWKQYGKAAGPIRNTHMASEADALIAIWDGDSKGTKNMIELARKNNLKVYIKETY